MFINGCKNWLSIKLFHHQSIHKMNENWEVFLGQLGIYVLSSGIDKPQLNWFWMTYRNIVHLALTHFSREIAQNCVLFLFFLIDIIRNDYCINNLSTYSDNLKLFKTKKDRVCAYLGTHIRSSFKFQNLFWLKYFWIIFKPTLTKFMYL